MTTVPQQLEPALPAIQLSTAGSSSSACSAPLSRGCRQLADNAVPSQRASLDFHHSRLSGLLAVLLLSAASRERSADLKAPEKYAGAFAQPQRPSIAG